MLAVFSGEPADMVQTNHNSPAGLTAGGCFHSFIQVHRVSLGIKAKATPKPGLKLGSPVVIQVRDLCPVPLCSALIRLASV
jgi:hypothetical protein